MSAHTPGPWVTLPGSLFVRARGCTVAEVIPQDTAVPNARLIAAAPDLLSLAHAFEAYLLGSGCDAQHELVVETRTAIAKARGGR